MAQSSSNPWFKAKDIIIDNYHKNIITDTMGAKEVYDMDEHKDIFHLVRWDRFCDNFRKLKTGGFQKPNSRGGRNANPWYVA